MIKSADAIIYSHLPTLTKMPRLAHTALHHFIRDRKIFLKFRLLLLLGHSLVRRRVSINQKHVSHYFGGVPNLFLPTASRSKNKFGTARYLLRHAEINDGADFDGA